jgi:transposase
MGRGKQLSDFEMGQIMTYKNQGKSVAKISELVNRSRRVIRNYIEDPENYGTKKSPGRPAALTPKEHRRVLRLASNE